VKGRKPPSIVTGATPVREIPKPPAWLSKDAKAEWRRVVPSLIERGVLDTGDLANLENYCLSVGRVREIEREIAKGYDLALDRAQQKAIATVRLLAGLFGLTPVDRSRPTIRDGADDDDGDLFGDE
jgi:P27 family predicted phage terminase small subunit